MDYTYKNYPELGEAIMEMYEMSDGRVGIDTVNNTVVALLGHVLSQQWIRDTL